MEGSQNSVKLYYNTEREKLFMPEYGRNIMKMVAILKTIDDKAKRTEQARVVVKAMELLNPQVHQQENYEQKLWDHLYMIAGCDLDIDAPYPSPVLEEMVAKPLEIPIRKKPINATHYGRNIESIIELIAGEPDGEGKTSMIRSLAIYMRQQYLIWNKDSVADETIFSDIEKLSDYRIKVLESISLNKISSDTVFSRPNFNVNVGQSYSNKKKRSNNQRRLGQKK